MEAFEQAAVGIGPSLTKATRARARKARELGCERVGLVEIDPLVCAHARADGGVEVWRRDPTGSEARAVLEQRRLGPCRHPGVTANARQ